MPFRYNYECQKGKNDWKYWFLELNANRNAKSYIIIILK